MRCATSLRVDMWAAPTVYSPTNSAARHLLDRLLHEANVSHQWHSGWVSVWVPPECALTLLQIDAAVKAVFGDDYGAPGTDVYALNNLRGHHGT